MLLDDISLELDEIGKSEVELLIDESKLLLSLLDDSKELAQETSVDELILLVEELKSTIEQDDNKEINPIVIKLLNLIKHL